MAIKEYSAYLKLQDWIFNIRLWYQESHWGEDDSSVEVQSEYSNTPDQ